MKIVTASGKQRVVMTRKEWEAIGKKAGWTKKAWHDQQADPEHEPNSALDGLLDKMDRVERLIEMYKKNPEKWKKELRAAEKELKEMDEVYDQGEKAAKEYLSE